MAIIGKNGPEYVGKCLEKHNVYLYDGDYALNMTVWNDAKNAPEDINYFDSRGGEQDHVDATDEIKAKYQAYLDDLKAKRLVIERNSRATSLNLLRKFAKDHGARYGFKSYRFTILRHFYNMSDLGNLVTLLSSNIRSDFKKSLRAQVIKWLQDEEPDYTTPLSAKQISYLVPQDYHSRYYRR